MKQSELIRIIERTAPLGIAAPWDKSGVQVASAREDIRTLAVCLDPTPESIRIALSEGADMVLAHHPLTMESRFPDRLDSYHDVLSLLFRADVPLYSAHTSLDANPSGPVSWLAEELGLCPLPAPDEDSRCESGFAAPLTVLERTGTMDWNGASCVCGFGVVGDCAVAVTPDELKKMLALWLVGSCPRLVGTLPERIRRIAICPGSGSSLAPEAAAAGADLLITGDVKYHAALEFPLPVLDVGHFSLEEEMMRRFALQLKEQASDVAVQFVPAQDPLAPFFPSH
ncbi:Nif3-like dinuclear metal center hexameric protein [uncultured Bilophila sp.]|uniref:Nif3-like dinuclear metal center hexameric protein n=1 Tax=uncultured Bilophila sp. TaxID=529385 RepID=UPI0026DB7D63|nr:Nif3-like dinuclear metal center hexameric protein [uncultured Bilophila sp.]